MTGASGFIGRHLVRRLRDESVPVRIVTRRPDIFVDGIEVVHADLATDPLPDHAMQGITTVLHLAGKTHDLSEAVGSNEHARVTVGGTARVLDTAGRVGTAGVVFVSSLAVYGRMSHGPLDETSRCEPSSAYGIAKLEAERLVNRFGAETGRHVAVLRPAMVYGAGCRGNLPAMIKAIDRGWFPPLPETGGRRSLVHVDDLVEAIVRVATSPFAKGETFVVADDHPYTARGMYLAILSALGRPVPRWTVPVAVLKTAAVGGDMMTAVLRRRAYFDSISLERLTGEAYFSATKLARLVGWRSTTTLEQALPAIIASLANERQAV